MSLFVCQKCAVVENTALSHFWLRGTGKALCSQCDPDIGKWHACFPRQSYDGIRSVAWVDGEWTNTEPAP